MLKKSIKIGAWAIVAVLAFSKIAYALEVDFPEFGGIKPADTFGPTQWIQYIFQFSLAAVGIALIYSFARAGLEWMFADTITNKKDAIDRIKSAVLGFVLLLGSYIILNTINPNLVDIRDPLSKGLINYIRTPTAGECNNSSECTISGEVCLNSNGLVVNEPSNNDSLAPKAGTCKLNPSSSTDNCGGGKACDAEFRCLNNATGGVILDPSDTTSPAMGTCTKAIAVGEACVQDGFPCFRGSVCFINPNDDTDPKNNKCTLSQ